MNPSSLAEDLLLAGANDWVHFGEVSWFVEQRGLGESRQDRIDEALAVIRSLVEGRLMQVGDVHNAGFSPWIATIDESLSRIRARWLSLEHDPAPGDVAWLANTKLGDRLAAELAQRAT